MKITIDSGSGDHPYIQIATQLRHAIGSGEITTRLPSLMELTEQTGAAPNTVRRAVQVLVGEGLVYTVPGRGAFVRRGK
jgi:DNA-binding GntR family transcriptional regulator